MSLITESQLRRAIRAQIIRKLNEAPEAPQSKSGAIDLTAVAEQVSDAIHQRELTRLQAKDKEVTQHTARQLSPHARAVQGLKSGAKLVKVMGRASRDGKPANLVIRAMTREEGAPVPISVVRNRSRQHIVADAGTRVFLFEDEAELQGFLDEELKEHGLAVDELNIKALSMHGDTGEPTYGYVATLKRI